MWSKEEGSEYFKALSSSDSLRPSVLNLNFSTTVGLYCVGVRFPEQTLLDFNSAVPNFALSFDSTGSHLEVCSYVVSTQIDSNSHDLELVAHHQDALRSAYWLAVGLSCASAAFITPFEMRPEVMPASFSDKLRGTTGLLTAQKELPRFRESLEANQGHLSCALQAWIHFSLDRWPERFMRTYLKSCTLSIQPTWSDFCVAEEAYLGFYKCLEYFIMARIIKSKGQLEARSLSQALHLLHIEPKDVEEPDQAYLRTSKYISRKRGESCAHFLKGASKEPVNHKDAYEIKAFLDFLLRAHFKLNPR